MNRPALLVLLLLPFLPACDHKPTPATGPVVAPANETAPAVEAAPGTVTTPRSTTAAPYATPEVLADYNRRLQAWVERTSYLPKRFEELHTLAGDCPRPPQPPPGQRLIFDRASVSVRIE